MLILQYKKSLGRIFGAATPPGALVSFWKLIEDTLLPVDTDIEDASRL
jgi:hypothetical protein